MDTTYEKDKLLSKMASHLRSENTLPSSTNLIGAITFWLYIIAALGLTSIVVRAIYNTPCPPSTKRQQGIFACLALLSFGTLSWNMLNVLIQSYLHWAQDHHISLPTTLYGGAHGPVQTPLHLLSWSTTSTLFTDFGVAIFATPSRIVWTNVSLWLTLLNILYISVTGRTTHQIPKSTLWAMIGVAEILPISFTQNLFYLLLLRRRRRQGQSSRIESKVTGMPNIWTLVTILCTYQACLMYAPFLAGKSSSHSNLVLLILFARTLLLLPMFIPLYSPSPSRVSAASSRSRTGSTTIGSFTVRDIVVIFTAVVTVGSTVHAVREGVSLSELVRAVNTHPAVSALGYDFLISVLSWGLWYTMGL